MLGELNPTDFLSFEQPPGQVGHRRFVASCEFHGDRGRYGAGMPEMIEVELYRQLADKVVGRRISRVDAPDAWYCKRSTTPALVSQLLPGLRVDSTERHGKLLVLHLGREGSAGEAELGLRFGMTGRLLVDGSANIAELLYSSDRNDPAWDRFVLTFEGGGTLAMRDPRRLGGVELDPDRQGLGPDATEFDLRSLSEACAKSASTIKARLLDQTVVAGIGNLLADEMLWRAGISPVRLSNSLKRTELKRLSVSIGSTIAELTVRGGSHTGDVMPERRKGGLCPRDGAAMQSATVGGRTSWWCSRHQK